MLYSSLQTETPLLCQVALITGADSGIGRAVALAYAREGADIAIAYLNEHEDAKVRPPPQYQCETKKVVEEAGRKVILIPGDIASEEHIKEIVAKTVDTFGRIDILVNNASMQGDAVEDFTQISRERLEKTFMVNIVGMISLAQKAVPHMKPGSAIINVASIQAYQPTPSILDYACTKGAIVTMTKALAKDLISKKGIRVNAVAPGPIWTPIPVESFTEDMVKNFGKGMTPINRAGQPAELAPAFVFLANNADSSYVNAEILGVTGGMPLS
ncbi:oxidoreductase YhxC [Coccomyxa subellipsoidea C-169]|uniref:Oxidoreductase YhxC n=1 Tax=Coccomyxa subellipsoidea (strain C-169) TaxID=574566 RepID=I0Z2R8_COCSC|nr:oxidoreductase YhxC [Coccomyxa subellipsoidea C-169]EIE24937.1 oxidoreductase YhxC [Coccomyxa subellipsoidea C-169]|eukprot:XP_005649481.1 oxidoreductase YhxC [Coccomyxa subellipsoidea C-169]